MRKLTDYRPQRPRARAVDLHHNDGIRRFWVAFTLAVITSFGVCSLLLAAVAAGLALFS